MIDKIKEHWLNTTVLVALFIAISVSWYTYYTKIMCVGYVDSIVVLIGTIFILSLILNELYFFTYDINMQVVLRVILSSLNILAPLVASLLI